MTTRRIFAPMLYPPSIPARWLRTLASAIDQAAGVLCRDQWQRGLIPCPQPARVRCVSPAPGKRTMG
jgi:hypothetical protein